MAKKFSVQSWGWCALWLRVCDGVLDKEVLFQTDTNVRIIHYQKELSRFSYLHKLFLFGVGGYTEYILTTDIIK